MTSSFRTYDLGELLEEATSRARDLEAHAAEDARIATLEEGLRELEEGLRELDEANDALRVELQDAQDRIVTFAERVDEAERECRIAQAVIAAHKLGGNEAVAALLDAPSEDEGSKT